MSLSSVSLVPSRSNHQSLFDRFGKRCMRQAAAMRHTCWVILQWRLNTSPICDSSTALCMRSVFDTNTRKLLELQTGQDDQPGSFWLSLEPFVHGRSFWTELRPEVIEKLHASSKQITWIASIPSIVNATDLISSSSWNVNTSGMERPSARCLS